MTNSPRQIDIRKAAAVIIQDEKLLVCREYGKSVFVAPGGKLDAGETPEQAVVRELREELAIEVAPKNLQEFGVFYAPAATNPGNWLEMTVYQYVGEIPEVVASAEIEELAWIGAQIPETMQVGSIFEHEVLPRLIAQGLVK